MGSYG